MLKLELKFRRGGKELAACNIVLELAELNLCTKVSTLSLVMKNNARSIGVKVVMPIPAMLIWVRVGVSAPLQVVVHYVGFYRANRLLA